MNPLVLLPLLVAGCVAAPTSGVVALHGAVPLGGVVATHSVTANVPAGVEYKQVGETVAVAAPVAAAVAVPGYKVDGEIRVASVKYPEPAPVAVDVKSLPVLSGVAPIAPIAPLAVAAAPAPVVELKAAEPQTIAVAAPPSVYAAAPAVYAAAPAVVAAAPAPVVYSGANLNIPAPIPQGEVGPQNVQTFKVKALGRPVVSYTPQITEVRPELNIVERTYDVAVPKPVYQTKEITPIVTKHIPEPYDVPAPYHVAQPVAVPHPVPAPYAVPTIQHVGVAHGVAPVASVGYAAHGVAPVAPVQYAAHGVAPVASVGYAAHGVAPIASVGAVGYAGLPVVAAAED